MRSERRGREGEQLKLGADWAVLFGGRRRAGPRSSLSRTAPHDDDTNAASECCEDRTCKRLVEDQRQAAKEGGEKSQQYQLASNAIHCQLLPVLANIARPVMVTREYGLACDERMAAQIIALSQVITRSAIEPHPFAVLARDDAEGVVLDFMQPLLAGRRLWG